MSAQDSKLGTLNGTTSCIANTDGFVYCRCGPVSFSVPERDMNRAQNILEEIVWCVIHSCANKLILRIVVLQRWLLWQGVSIVNLVQVQGTGDQTHEGVRALGKAPEPAEACRALKRFHWGAQSCVETDWPARLDSRGQESFT